MEEYRYSIVRLKELREAKRQLHHTGKLVV
jgi:hypothetical protein